MFAIFCKEAAGSAPFSAANHFVFKLFTVCRHFANKFLVAVQTFFWIRPLKDQVFTVEAEISFCIVAAKSKLLNIFKMMLIRI